MRFGVVGQPLHHLAETAGLLAGRDQGDVQLGEHARIFLQRARQRMPRQHLAAHPGQHLALVVGIGLLDQRVERLLHRQAGGQQGGELARDQAQLRAGQAAPPVPAAAAARLRGFGHRRHVRHQQPLFAQPGAQLARSVGFQHALASGGRRRRRPRSEMQPCRCSRSASRVTRTTSSRRSSPARTQRMPSSRSEPCRAPRRGRAASCSEARSWIMRRSGSSTVSNS